MTKALQLLQVHFDLLVGADGVNSAVRHFLEQQMPTFEGEVLHFNDRDSSSKLFKSES